MQKDDLMYKLDLLLTKENITMQEELELKDIQLQLDQIYLTLAINLNMAKGVLIRPRVKGLEEGERNITNFFALMKMKIINLP